MHNTSHEIGFAFVDITNRRSLKVISEIRLSLSPCRPASSSASASRWTIAVEFYGGWRISSYFDCQNDVICEFNSPKTMELILVVVISAGMAENSQNGVSRSLLCLCLWSRL